MMRKSQSLINHICIFFPLIIYIFTFPKTKPIGYLHKKENPLEKTDTAEMAAYHGICSQVMGFTETEMIALRTYVASH